MDRRSEAWILNLLVGKFGVDTLHPGGRSLHEISGIASADSERVWSMVKSGAMLQKAWATRAAEVERTARRAMDEAFPYSAAELYLRASLLYGCAQYVIYRDIPAKKAYHAKLVECFRRMMELSPTRIERVQIPFQTESIYAILFLPPAPKEKVPVILIIPGMDTIKEGRTKIVLDKIIPRCAAAFVIDGPGQGESLVNGLKVTVENYEQAASTAVDYLAKRPEIDSNCIGAIGYSMGSHWVTRLAAAEPRLKAAAACMGVFGSKDIIFNAAQPNYRNNFKYMSGIYDDAAFDQMAEQMRLDKVAPNIKCPYLMVHGEFDELCPAEDALDIYELMPTPKEVWLYENQFHPLALVQGEVNSLMVDWIVSRLRGVPLKSKDRRLFIKEDGRVIEGDARPLWWTPDRLLKDG